MKKVIAMVLLACLVCGLMAGCGAKKKITAEEAVATGQSYQIGSRMLTRADLKQIRNEMEYWAEKLAQAEAEEKTGGRNRAYRAVIRDV